MNQKGRQNISSPNRKNFSRRIMKGNIEIITQDKLCKKCGNNKFIKYFTNNQIKCSKCKNIEYRGKK